MFMNTWGCCTIEDLQSDVSQYCIFVHPLSSIYLDVCFSGWSLEYQQTSVSSCSYYKGRYQWSHLPTAPWHPHLTHPPPPSCVPLLPLSQTSPHPKTPSSNCLMKSFNNFQNMNPSIVIPLSSILQAQPSHQCLTEYLFISSLISSSNLPQCTSTFPTLPQLSKQSSSFVPPHTENPSVSSFHASSLPSPLTPLILQLPEQIKQLTLSSRKQGLLSALQVM